MDYIPIYSRPEDVYSLTGFMPQTVDAAYLQRLGVHAEPRPETLEALTRGSRIFAERLRTRTLLPERRFFPGEMDPEKEKAEIHNYTGHCPTLTYEINPVRGCGVGCQYCLVTDGVHEEKTVAFENYPLYVRRLLEEKNGAGSDNGNHYYYFSPKTEAFQEATLLTGIAHRILHEFIEHFRRRPDSNARLFIASKAGAKHLLHPYEGETVLDLFGQLRDRMQFNTSVSLMPAALRDLLEPYAAPIEERMKAVQLCREHGVRADSALVQPIVPPCLSEEEIRSFFGMLHEAGIRNYKPEFLTVCMENLAMLGQYLGHFDRDMERQLYEDYLLPVNADHRKQRGRTAPDRKLSLDGILRMMHCTDTLGMSISICYWVRKQLGIPDSLIPVINRNGFQCLGYQTGLFSHVQ